MSQQRVLMQIDGEPEKKAFPTITDAIALYRTQALAVRLWGRNVTARLFFETNGQVSAKPDRELSITRTGLLRQTTPTS